MRLDQKTYKLIKAFHFLASCFIALNLSTLSLMADVLSTSGNINFDVNSDSQNEASLNVTGLGIGVTAQANLHVGDNAIITENLSIGSTSVQSSSNLHISGTLGFRLNTVSDNATLSDHSIVLVDNSTGNVTLTLPDASSYAGRIYTLKSLSSMYSLMAEGDEIDGYSGVALSGDGNIMPSVSLISDGSTWHTIDLNSSTILFYSLPIRDYFNMGNSDGAFSSRSDQSSLQLGWQSNRWTHLTGSVVYEAAINLNFSNSAYNNFRNDSDTGSFRRKPTTNGFRGNVRQLNPVLSGTFWFSALINMETLSGWSLICFADAKGGYGTTPDGFGLSGDASNYSLFFHDDSAGTDTDGNANSLQSDTTYLLLAKTVINASADDHLEVWVFKESDTIGGTEAALGSANLSITTANFGDGFEWLRVGGHNNSGSSSDAEFNLDAIRIAQLNDSDEALTLVLEGQGL